MGSEINQRTVDHHRPQYGGLQCEQVVGIRREARTEPRHAAQCQQLFVPIEPVATQHWQAAAQITTQKLGRFELGRVPVSAQGAECLNGVPREHARRVLEFRDGPCHGRQCGGRIQVVISQPGEVTAFGLRQQGVHVAHFAQIHRVIDDPHARVAGANRPGIQLASRIVVAHQDFDICAILPQHGLQRLAQQLEAVVGGDADGKKRRRWIQCAQGLTARTWSIRSRSPFQRFLERSLTSSPRCFRIARIFGSV